MSTKDRVRKAWLEWELEIKHSTNYKMQVFMSSTTYRDSLREAFEAGYRAVRRHNDKERNKVAQKKD